MDILNKLVFCALLLGVGYYAGKLDAPTLPNGTIVSHPVTAGDITDLKHEWEQANGRELYWVDGLPVIGVSELSAAQADEKLARTHITASAE